MDRRDFIVSACVAVVGCASQTPSGPETTSTNGGPVELGPPPHESKKMNPGCAKKFIRDMEASA